MYQLLKKRIGCFHFRQKQYYYPNLVLVLFLILNICLGRSLVDRTTFAVISNLQVILCAIVKFNTCDFCTFIVVSFEFANFLLHKDGRKRNATFFKGWVFICLDDIRFLYFFHFCQP